MRKIYLQFRNWMHVVGFFALAYWGLGFFDLNLWVWQKIALGLFLSAIGYGIGHGYEALRKIFFNNPTSNSDGNLSWIGFTIGSALVLFYPGIVFINVYVFWFCLILFIFDNVYPFIKKK